VVEKLNSHGRAWSSETRLGAETIWPTHLDEVIKKQSWLLSMRNAVHRFIIGDAVQEEPYRSVVVARLRRVVVARCSDFQADHLMNNPIFELFPVETSKVLYEFEFYDVSLSCTDAKRKR